MSKRTSIVFNMLFDSSLGLNVPCRVFKLKKAWISNGVSGESLAVISSQWGGIGANGRIWSRKRAKGRFCSGSPLRLVL